MRGVEGKEGEDVSKEEGRGEGRRKNGRGGMILEERSNKYRWEYGKRNEGKNREMGELNQQKRRGEEKVR